MNKERSHLVPVLAAPLSKQQPLMTWEKSRGPDGHLGIEPVNRRSVCVRGGWGEERERLFQISKLKKYIK